MKGNLWKSSLVYSELGLILLNLKIFMVSTIGHDWSRLSIRIVSEDQTRIKTNSIFIFMPKTDILGLLLFLHGYCIGVVLVWLITPVTRLFYFFWFGWVICKRKKDITGIDSNDQINSPEIVTWEELAHVTKMVSNNHFELH